MPLSKKRLVAAIDRIRGDRTTELDPRSSESESQYYKTSTNVFAECATTQRNHEQHIQLVLAKKYRSVVNNRSTGSVTSLRSRQKSCSSVPKRRNTCLNGVDLVAEPPPPVLRLPGKL